MNIQLFGTVLFFATALVLQFHGPADAHLEFYAVGGDEDCNASDHRDYDCKPLDPMGMCTDKETINETSTQHCKDEFTEMDYGCLENQCTNEVLDDYKPSPCNQVGCDVE